MKSIFTLIAITLSLVANSQIDTCNNFRIVDNKIVWQKVYLSNITKRDIVQSMLHSGNFKNIDTSTASIIATSISAPIDYKKLGFNNFDAPIFIRDSYVNFFVVIDSKEGRYRATAKSINTEQRYTDPFSEMGTKITMEERFVKNGMFKNLFKSSKASLIFDKYFTDLFLFKPLKPDVW